MWKAYVGGIILTCMALTAGCGGGGSDQPSATAQVPTFKIQEFAGDGHNGTKPLPAFARSAGMVTQRLGDLLGMNRPVLPQLVPEGHTNWFRLGPGTVSAEVIVTVQPTDANDPDLYIMEGNSSGYNDGASVEAYSNRTGSTGFDGPDPKTSGYVPDWAAISVSNTGDLMGQVAVHGASGTSNFTVEGDRVFPLPTSPDAWTGTLPQGNSHWLMVETSLTSVVLNDYDFHFTALSGDPDAYFYRNTSSGATMRFLSNSLGTEDGTLSLVPGTTVYIRVYGFGSGDNHYSLYYTTGAI